MAPCYRPCGPLVPKSLAHVDQQPAVVARAHSFDAVQGAPPDYLMEPSGAEDVIELHCNRTLAGEV